MTAHIFLALSAALFLAAALPATAARAPDEDGRAAVSALCDAAAARAALRENVPLEVLRAVALVETGRRVGSARAPWPWTVNVEGEGRWFDAPAPLLAHLRAVQARGVRSFDVGCFQLNHRWHGAAFASLKAMLDPDANARYAARFLRQLRDEAGSWVAAAGLYHSRTPSLARGYRSRFETALAALGPPLAAPPTREDDPPPLLLRPARASGWPMAALSLPPAAGRQAAPQDAARRRSASAFGGAALLAQGGGALIVPGRGPLLAAPPGPLLASSREAR